MEVLAKPTGITYYIHTENVIAEGENIIKTHPFVIEKYASFTNSDLAKRLTVASKYHDEGKKNEIWQKACLKDYEIYLRTGKVGCNLLKTGIRHEIESLKLKTGFSDVVKVAIASHHGKLSERFSYRWNDNNENKNLWKTFKRLQNELRLCDFEKAILLNYEFAGCRSYLQLADHRASAIEENKQVPSFTPFHYDFNPLWTKRNVQKIAEDNWQDDLLLMRAPTGAGKTDACLLWAKKQIENNRADRLVIAMPTRFTSNALAINIEASLSETGLYHSSAWYSKFNESFESKEKYEFAKQQHHFAKLLETPVTVCTIDHLLISLTHTKEEHHSITFNLAHSCVVIDEADFYDDFTQANIIELLKALSILKVPVLIMSASLPESSLKMYQTTGYSPKEIREDRSDCKRIRCRVANKIEYRDLDDLETVLEKALEQPTIIYANTVNRAISLYNWFINKKRIKPILYHSRFIESDKVKKEDSLIKNLGKEAWKNNNASGIAILTQIGEMSINISSHYMISELCPMDRLVQRIGRLSRFDEIIGLIDILLPFKKNSLYPAPYGYYQKSKGWIPVDAMIKTLELLECKEYNAEKFVELINQIYPDMMSFSSDALNNIDNYRKNIVYHWLITPQENVEEESTNFWKSRNIGNQNEVFILNPESINNCFFSNFNEYNLFRNEYSLSCPNYLISKAIENGSIYKQSIRIRNEEKNIYIAQYYNDEVGLILENDVFL